MTAVLVALGGALGALARYGVGTLVPNDRLPWATVGINIAGSFLLGFLVASGERLSPELRTGLAVGLLGGFTTFSTFSADVFFEFESGDEALAGLLVLVSVGCGVAAAGVGWFLGRRLAH